MTSFREAADAIRRPLSFALRGDEAAASIHDLQGTLRAALLAASQLWIPPEARKRLREAAERLEGDADPAGLAWIAKRLAPLLEPEFPARMLAQPASRVPGVGPKTAQALARKEIATVEDLLFFLPRAYEDRREISSIEKLEVGRFACFAGTVTRSGVVPLRNGRRFFEAIVSDGTGAVQLKWFRGLAHFENRLAPGTRVLVAGEVRRFRYAKELHHPDIEPLSAETSVGELPRIVATYSAVEGLAPRSLRRVVESAVRCAADLVDGFLPASAVAELGLAGVGASLREVHLPGTQLDPNLLRERSTPYHLRLVAEELYLLQIGLGLRKRALLRRHTAALPIDDEVAERAIAALPFPLTADQRRAWTEIRADLSRSTPMNRMLIGDVGSGKTVLALLAAVAAHAAGRTTAVLAPTEILAEQHRFGVEQRRALARKAGTPHLLAMSATPIPRSLALTVFGDLEHSVLRERPPGRAPVSTQLVGPSAGRAVMDALHETLRRGEQVFVVYPLVDESEKQDLKDATRGFERMGKALPGVPAALIHGRMDARERQRAMADFAEGRVRILVATTVIEVGVDVPNATLLIVQHAERFGLAQLHQLRGRVGRGEKPGQAILIADPTTPEGAQRLAILERSHSGFEIAEEDLRIRGAGEWLGTRQAGHLPELRMADLVRHGDTLEAARRAAASLLEGDPELRRMPALRAAVERRWGARLALGSIG